MAIQTATNPQTGERVALVGDEWQPIAQTATNKAGAKAYLVGDQWIVDDTPVAKATPKAAPKSTQAAEPVEYDFGAAMAADIAPAETSEKKVYTGSVFDTQPFDPKITPAEADRLSRRAYAEATTKPPRRTQYVQATPEEQLKRTTGQAALDTTIGLLQGAVGIPKSIASNINAGDNPVARFYESASQAGQRAKSPYLQSQAAEREAFIKNVTANQGELAGTRATFTSMFSPAGADIVAQGAGSMIPTVGLSLLSLGQKSMMAMNALSVAGEAAQSTAQKLSQMSPENWSNSSAYQELRSSGMSHRDAVNMLAPLFAIPNQLLGGVIGRVSGSTGLEKTLAGKSITGGARERAARAGSELLGEQAETLVPSFVANVTQRIFDDKQSLVEGLGKEAVETAAGTVPGAALAASGRAGKPSPVDTQAAVSTPVPQPEAITPVQERVEPTFDAAEFDRTAPPPPITPTAPAPVAEAVAPTEQVKAIAERLQKRGISRKAALAMAEREVKANEPTPDETGGAANVVEPISTPSGESVNLAEQPSAELPPRGVAGAEPSGVVSPRPTTAGVTVGEGTQPTALEEKSISFEIRSADKQEQSITSGAVATLPLPGGAKAIFTQNGDGDIELIAPDGKPDKVVRAHDAREGAVRSLEDFPDYVPEPLRQLMLYYQRAARENYYAEGDSKEATQQRLNEVQDEIINTAKSLQTEGADLGIETPEAVEATQERQEAPPAGGVAGKRGPKPKPAEVKAQIRVSRNEQNRINNYAEDKRKKFVAQLQQTLTPEQIEELSFEEAEQAEIDARQSRRSALRGLVELQDNPNIARGSAVGKRISAALKDSKATEAELADIRRGIKAAKDVLTGPKEDVLGAVEAPGVSGKTEAKASKSADVRVDKPDAGFSKLTNGSQAITHIVKNGSLFQRFVAERIRNFMVGVKFVVVEEGDATPANILAEMEGARGLFVYTPGQKDRTVYVRGSSFGDQQGINNVTVLHELLHAATASRIQAGLLKGFKNASLQKFMREMGGVMKSAEDAYRAGIRTGAVSSDLQDLVEADAENVEFDDRGRPKFQIFTDHNEFLAYGMSSPEFQKFLMGVQGTRKETSIFSRFTNSIRDLFGIKQGEATAFSDLIDITDKMLNTRLTAVKMGRTSLQQKGPLTEEQKAQREKEKAVTRALKAVDRSFEAEKISEETEVLQRLRSLNVAPVLKEAAKGMSSLQRKAISKALSTPLVAEIGGVNVPELINTNRLLEDMEASKMEMLRAGAKIVDDIKRLLPTDESRKKVSRAALIFTASRVDPRVDTSVVRLNKIYDDLTADEKKALDEIAGYYGDIMDNYDYLLGENVKALRPGEAAKLTAALREALGKENRIPFYVPLARDQNGEFYLRVGTTEFHIRKTEAERDRLAEDIAKERNTTVDQLLQDNEIEIGNDIEVLRRKVLDSSDALRRIFIMIEDADFTAEEHGASLQQAKDGMKDSIFQLWLHMQPESSSRKQFIHRNKYPPAGFRTDIIQNLAESVLKFSNNMARLEYAPQLRRSISQAHASIKNRPAYTPYVAEMALRVDDTLAPDNQSIAMGVARFGNSFTFGYYMSESTALLQLLSVYQVGTAQLAKKFPLAAVAKEAAKMGQMWKTVGVKNEYGEWVMPTIEQALNLESRPTDSAKVRLDKEQDRAFIDAMHERNVSESTGARDLQGYKDLPTEKYGNKYERAKRVGRFVVGGLIHATERLSREVMFMSSAHLVRDKAVAEFRKTAEYKNAPDKIAAERAFGEANLDSWADQAKVYTDAALFNYSESAKPRYMRGAIGRVALQFFTYQLNVGSFIARNFIGMIKPLPGDTRVECMRAFSTLMATTFSLGGTQALFGGPIVLGLISIIMKLSKDADEPDELKDIDLYERFKIFLHEQLGDVIIGGKPLSKIVDQGPVNAFTGLDVSSRISVSNILTPPEVKAARTPQEGVLSYAQLYGGANLQAVIALATGVDLLVNKGEHYRGFEKLMPWAFVRNKMVAARQKMEGEKSLKLGDDVVEAELFYTGELVGQAVGLRPVLLSDVAAANRKAYEVVNKVVTKRQAILDRLDRADRKGDDKAYLAALEDQEKFNAKVSLEFPRLQISEEDRYNFIQGRNEARRTSFGGFQYTPQNEVMAEQITNRSREALVKREKEIREKVDLTGMAEKNPR
jgi:hypothetical protein